jgi:predicted O-methyltransferase YrrM
VDNTIKKRILRFAGITLGKQRVSSEFAFTTHLPILMGLGLTLPVKRLLELGCGRHSTLMFLDKTIYANLEKLDSLENDRAWADTILALAGQDPKLTLTVVDGAMSSVLPQYDFSQYDLVFIDDSKSIPERVATMRQVVRLYSTNNIIVAHDFEQTAYQDALSEIPNKYIFTSLVPNTAVLWKDAQVDLLMLEHIHALLEKYSRTLSPESKANWRKVFISELIK